MKGEPDLAEIPVVIVTIVDEQRRGVALGAAGYLTKPIDRERLVAILRDSRVIVPGPDDPLEAGDELLFVTSQNVERELAKLLGCAA